MNKSQKSKNHIKNLKCPVETRSPTVCPFLRFKIEHNFFLLNYKRNLLWKQNSNCSPKIYRYPKKINARKLYTKRTRNRKPTAQKENSNSQEKKMQGRDILRLLKSALKAWLRKGFFMRPKARERSSKMLWMRADSRR